MLEKVSPTWPNVALVKTDNSMKSVGDDTHFDAAAQRELGKRYAAAYLALIHTPTTKPSSNTPN